MAFYSKLLTTATTATTNTSPHNSYFAYHRQLTTGSREGGTQIRRSTDTPPSINRET